jgi:hypothetical protein
MLLAYVHCFGSEADCPELCIVATKPDSFSVPVRIDSLVETEAGIYCLSLTEAMVVRKDPGDGGIILEPLRPTKLFLTPDLHDQPGLTVRKAKVVKKGERRYESFFLQERHAEGDWQKWEPLKRQV